MTKNSEQIVITDFTNLASQKWRVVNDGVMGGISQSTLQINTAGNGVFFGKVSLKNNGGFASVKNLNPLNLSGYSEFWLRLLGDGSRYSFRFRTENDGDPHYWVYEIRFETEPDKWLEISLPFTEFIPVYRGKALADIPPPDLSSICEYAILISDKQEGPFRLEIDWIKASAS
ncbi:MAG: CIA30 family protein [Balneolaceae bacterium]|nr:MAG: CIA30 family protein [Balneolaceae bacterium]